MQGIFSGGSSCNYGALLVSLSWKAEVSSSYMYLTEKDLAETDN